MLSMTNMNSEQASHYHKEEQNYYQSETELGTWQGKGLKALELEEFKFEDFERLCHGIHPHCAEVVVDTKKLALTDMTFSAPKSVSSLMEVSNKEDEFEIRKAHDQAVVKTLNYIETYSQTREQIDGRRQVINTENLVIAKFQHDTSRETAENTLDPQLHTHCGILNMTQKKNGEWRALHNIELYKNKELFGVIYRSHLAKNLNEIGYTTEVTNAKLGFFQINGVSKELNEEFSKRRKQVLERYEELRKQYPQMEEAKLKEMSTLDSRKKKDKTLDRKKIRAKNIKRAETIEDISNIVENCKSIKSQEIQSTAKEYLNRAKEILTDKESVFTKEELLKQSMKLSIGQYTLDDFQKEISNDKELVNFEKNIYSTKEMIQREKEILINARATLNTQESISNKNNSKDFIEKNYTTMTKGQKEAFSHILTNTDLISAIQGDAGTGKTYMLKAVNQFIKENNSQYTLQGLSFTGKAADEIEKESNIKSNTLHSFLNQIEFKENQIYITDEASMTGSKQFHQLQQIAKDTHSRIILLGDTKQFQTLSAGGIFEKLQNEKAVKTVYMSESMRAQTKTMKSLYKDIKEKNIYAAFNTLDKNKMINEGINYNDIKNEYLKDKDNTLLISSKNSDRKELNRIIRESLKKELFNEITIKIKESANLHDIEKHFSQHYKKEQVIFIQKSIPGLKAGTECQIKNIDHDKNTILISTKNKNIEIDLKKYGNKLSSFNLEDKKFAVNDKIIFTKNDKNINIKNGQTASIIDIQNNLMTLKKENGTEIKINTNKYNYLDYGYAITDFKSQGGTGKKVIAISDSQMANSNSFYVAVTRAKEHVKIYTDSIERLKENTQNTQIKTSTLDYIKKSSNQTQGENNGQEHRRTINGLLGQYSSNIKDELRSLKNNIGTLIKRAREQWRKEFKRDTREHRNEINEYRTNNQSHDLALNAVKSLTKDLTVSQSQSQKLKF